MKPRAAEARRYAIAASNMKIYQIGNSDGESTNFSVCTPIINSDWFYLCWSLGRPFEQKIEEPIIYNVNGEADIEDFPITNADQFLISDNIHNILQNTNAKYHAYLSVLIKENGTQIHNYYSINFLESFSCYHRDLSKYRIDEDGFVRFDEEPIYDKSLIPANKEIFRSADGVEIFATEKFREKIILNEITGMGFREVVIV